MCKASKSHRISMIWFASLGFLILSGCLGGGDDGDEHCTGPLWDRHCYDDTGDWDSGYSVPFEGGE